jgi:hypothetical protein
LSKSQRHQDRKFKILPILRSPGDPNPCQALVDAGVRLSFGLFFELRTAATGSNEKKSATKLLNYRPLSPLKTVVFSLLLYLKEGGYGWKLV